MGELQTEPFQFTFNGFLKVAFQGSRITSDAGLILVRELDERLGLGTLISEHLNDSRQGLNTQFSLADLLRQSVYSRLAGYEDLNDAVRVSADPTFRLIGSPKLWDRGAALTSTLHWFETELLTQAKNLAISEFPKWRKYLISLSFRDKSSVRPVQVGGFEANIVVHRSTAVRGRGGPPPPWESSCRTRTGPVEADGTVDAQNAPTAPWKTLRVFHELPQGLSHRITHAKPRKAPKWRWETRIDPRISSG